MLMEIMVLGAVALAVVLDKLENAVTIYLAVVTNGPIQVVVAVAVALEVVLAVAFC